MTSCKPPPTCIDASPIPDANDSRMSAIPYEANLTPMGSRPLRSLNWISRVMPDRASYKPWELEHAALAALSGAGRSTGASSWPAAPVGFASAWGRGEQPRRGRPLRPERSGRGGLARVGPRGGRFPYPDHRPAAGRALDGRGDATDRQARRHGATPGGSYAGPLGPG